MSSKEYIELKGLSSSQSRRRRTAVTQMENPTISSEPSSPNPPSSSSSSSSEADEEEPFRNRVDDYTSWDDTICSNRSAYFKHYYQKNVSVVPSRQSTRASSHTSLMSLIKEKRRMSLAKTVEDKDKKKENLGLMALVIFLFLILVVGISLIYHFYNLHLEELSLFTKLKYHENPRYFNVLDTNGNVDIQAKLGRTFSIHSKEDDCTLYLQYLQNIKIREENKKIEKYSNQSATDFHLKNYKPLNVFQFDEETVCRDWANQARVQIHKEPEFQDLNCYNVYWSAAYAGLPLQDCIQIKTPEYGVWWGIGDITEGAYPLESRNIASSPLISGQLGKKNPWGRVLRRTFVSSLGGVLVLPDHLPASISVNSEELCIAVNVSTQVDKTVPLILNYTVCASPNISSAMKYLHHLAMGPIANSSNLNHTKQEILRDRIGERIENPVWIPYMLSDITQDSVLDYAEKIVNQSMWGHILLPSSWEKNVGSFEFDKDKFPDPKNLTKTLKRQGLHLALTLSPLVSTDTEAFKYGTKEGFLLQQKNSSLPVLLNYDVFSAVAMIDFTNPRSASWFIEKLTDLKTKYGIDRFHINPPDSQSIPFYHEFSQNIENPDLAIKHFIKAVSKVSPLLSTDSSLGPPSLPTFVKVGTEESGWASLFSLVPRILTLTMIGFPLIDAGIVGGNPDRPGNVPDDELFIRWVQVATFLPAFQMSTLPNFYEANTLSIVSKYLKKREELVFPRLKYTLENTLKNNTPLISPLALVYPEDPEAISISDEWIIGDDLLVAPVLEKGKTSRDIYIPDGLWECQLDLRLKRGPGWIYNYKVPLTDVAYFIKKYYSALSR